MNLNEQLLEVVRTGPTLQNPYTIRDLLRLGADVDYADSSGDTALMRIAHDPSLNDNIAPLLAGGADVNHVNIHGDSVLLRAYTYNNIEHIAALVAAGADVTKNNVLSMAQADGTSEVVETLLMQNSISVKERIIQTVDANTNLGVENPFNISLDSDFPGMFFRYGRNRVVSIYYPVFDKPRVAYIDNAEAPICAGQGRVIYTRRDGKVYENNIRLHLTEENALCHPISSRLEKNWGCFGREHSNDRPGNFFIVHSVIPLRIFRVEDYRQCAEVPPVQLEHAQYRAVPNNARVKREYPNFEKIEDMFVDGRDSRGISIFRGGTRGIKFGDEYLFVGHVTLTKERVARSCFQDWYMQRNNENNTQWQGARYDRMYFMYFFTIGLTNGMFKLSRISSCFQPPSSGTFHKIIFPCGIAHRNVGDEKYIVVSFGRDDNDCLMTSYSEAEINTMLAPTGSWTEKTYTLHPNYASSLRRARSLTPQRSIWRSILPSGRVGLLGTSPESDGCFNPAITNVGTSSNRFVTAWRRLRGDLQSWKGYNQIAIESCSLKIHEGELVYSRDSEIVKFQAGTTTVGGEDPRLITENDCALVFINDLDANGRRRMYVHNLETDDSAMTIHPFCHDMSGQMEKNWGPFYVDGELHFVYNVDEFVVAKVEQGSVCPSPTSTNIQCQKLPHVHTAPNLSEIFDKHGLKMRGGTPGLLYGENEYLFVGHAVQKMSNDGCFPSFPVQRSIWRSTEPSFVKMYNQFYTAFFYTIEKKDGVWRIKRLSCCSHFPGKRGNFTKIHFPAGLAKADLGGEFSDAFVVSFGEQDVYGGFCVVNRKFIECVLRPVEDWNVHNYVVDLNYFQNIGVVDPDFL